MKDLFYYTAGFILYTSPLAAGLLLKTLIVYVLEVEVEAEADRSDP